MSRPLRVRDPIHGFIPYTEVEEQLINAPIFQRLRGVKQLAFTHLVYPGATHTRFEHSLGVMHVAGRIAERVGITPNGNTEREWQLVRLAALLHDIGHLPFSHAGEAATLLLAPAKIGERKEEAHESITAALIERDPDIKRVVASEEDRLAILDILEKGRNTEPLLWQILSGPLDADKLDYLLRDSLMTGVKYGVFDLDRVVDSFTAHGSHGDRHLMVREEDHPCVEQYVLARYYMTEQVYRHRVRRITDLMLRDAVVSAASLGDDVGEWTLSVFGCRTDAERWRHDFLSADDASLLRSLSMAPEGQVCGRFGRRLRDRRLPKQMFECTIQELRNPVWEERLTAIEEEQERLLNRFAEALGVSTDTIRLEIRAGNNPLHRDPNASVEEAIIVVNGKTDETRRLSDLPGSLSQGAKVQYEAKLYVYVEADDASESDREEMARVIENSLMVAAKEGSA